MLQIKYVTKFGPKSLGTFFQKFFFHHCGFWGLTFNQIKLTLAKCTAKNITYLMFNVNDQVHCLSDRIFKKKKILVGKNS